MSHAVFQFGEFVIDPAARELWQSAQRIALPPKSFECLAYLLENRERAVGRDEAALRRRSADHSILIGVQRCLSRKRSFSPTPRGAGAMSICTFWIVPANAHLRVTSCRSP